jgi:two-component system NarL family sensor kinase
MNKIPVFSIVSTVTGACGFHPTSAINFVRMKIIIQKSFSEFISKTSHLKVIATFFCLLIFAVIDANASKLEEENIDSLISRAKMFREQLKPDSSIKYYSVALENAYKYDLKKQEAYILKEIGMCYEMLGIYNKSAENLYNSIKISEQINDTELLASAMISLGIVYFDMGRSSDAIEYYNKAYSISKINTDTINMIRAINNIGNAYLTLDNESEKAIPYFEKTVELAIKINYGNAVIAGLTNLVQIYTYKNELIKALNYSKKVMDMCNAGPFIAYNIANIYRQIGKPDSALYFMQISMDSSYTHSELKKSILKDISDIYQEKGDYRKAYEYYVQYTTLKDTLHKENEELQIHELKTLYETEKKESKISHLTIINQKQKIRNRLLLLCLLFAIGLCLLFIITIRNRKKIALQDIEIKETKIRELEKESQIVAAIAALQGEESERSRLARDLHDGLGGLLSGIKFKLNHLKGNFLLDNSSKTDFENTLELLDSSVKELRRVAHNMMPEALIKLGLKDATSDFCSEISNPTIQVDFRFYGENRRIDQKIEISSFRIIQELVNNALKHSEASQIVVQIVQEAERLSISVQDNGKGFDLKKLETNKGVGLSSIKSRVAAHNGTIDINIEPGKGTEIQVEFGI